MNPARFGVLLATAGALTAQSPAGTVLLLPDTVPVVVQPESDPASARNVSLTVTLLRHRPAAGAKLSPNQLAACTSLNALTQTLRTAGVVEVLCHTRREVACMPMARADIISTESRPVVLLSDKGGTATNSTYGLDLHVDVRPQTISAPAASPGLSLEWAGSWSGSVGLLSRWETYAVRGFNLVKAIPHITYQKMEEDEDGFVNTGGGSTLGGLFGRKKNDQKTGKPTVAKLAAAVTAPVGHEPSYLADSVVEKVPLHGQWQGPTGQLLVTRLPLSAGEKPGELYLVIQPRSVD